MKTLLIGAGHSRTKLVRQEGKDNWEGELITLDINPEVKPDIIHDLNILPIPLPDNEFNEIHAYEVLEHTGTQGDYKFFFNQFDDFSRILKPHGLMYITCPLYKSVWAWGDPGHTRLLSPETFQFLNRDWYEEQIKVNTRATDYRHYFKSNWKIDHVAALPPHQFAIVLRNLKLL